MANRKAYYESFNSSGKSSRYDNTIPPWCSSGKVPEKRKLPLKWEIQSSYPLRKNIWEYLYDGKNLKCCSKTRNRKMDKVKRCPRKTKKILLGLLVIAGLIASSWKLYPTQCFNLMEKVMAQSKVLTFAWANSSVREECRHKMKHLTLELSRAEQILRSTYRYRMTMSTSQVKQETRTAPNSRYIAGASAIKGSGTDEWFGRVYLWGMIPLWRTASPPDTVLSVRPPTPADCWPFSGSSGELHIQLARVQRVQSISIEHVKPDTARSAPKSFITYGVLINGTRIELVKNEYRRYGPAKQYFPISIDVVIHSVIFNVLNNQGNSKYTCIYRVHLHGN